MAAYPSYPNLLASTPEPESLWRDDVSESGSLHSRQLRSVEYVRFNLMHNVTTAEYNNLRSLALTRDTYTLTYQNESPQLTYSVKFVSPPKITKNHGGGRHTVRVVLRGTQD